MLPTLALFVWTLRDFLGLTVLAALLVVSAVGAGFNVAISVRDWWRKRNKR